ncbi:MAG: TonB-dependent receptor [Bacteroidota bacterium]
MKYYHIIFSLVISIFLWTMSSNVYAQQIVGTVNSNYDEALMGVNVLIKESNEGTSTDIDGNFEIDGLAAGTYTLQFSSVGFTTLEKTVEVTTGQTTKVFVILNTSFTELKDVYVTGAVLQEENQTITVNEIDLLQIKTLHIEQPLRLIEQVPGVDLVAFRQGGVADQFSIRGFGGGGHEGQAGVQIDGISLNEAEGHSDGYADMNILIPINLRTLKVYKGPSSALFGRFAQGGTLALETRKGGNYHDVSFSAGSWNTFDTQFAMGQELGFKNSAKVLPVNLAFQLFQTDGYADNSDILRGNVNGRVAYNLSDRTDIALSLRGHSSSWNAPGYITEAQFNDKNRRNQQDEFAENDGGEKQFYSQRLDINHNINDNMRLLVFGYAVQQEFTRFAKFGYSVGGQSERFNTRDVFAVGSSVNANSNIGSTSVNWTAGVELYNETTERMRWNTSNRVRSEQTQDREFGIQSLSAFGQADFEINRYFRPSIGLRYDVFNGSFDAQDPGSAVISDEIDGLSNFSPKLGIRSSITDHIDLRVNVSQGFSLPNSALKYDENIDLDPIILWQYEAGAHYRLNDKLELDVVGFVLNSSNEIVENPPGSLEFFNAGKTRRTGVESQAIFRPVERLRIAGTFSYTSTEITENPGDESLVGRELIGIPQTIGTLDISYTTRFGLGARYMFRDVGEYFTSSDNSFSYEGYTVSNISFFYQFDPLSANSSRIFFEVKNVFNEDYAEAVFVIGGGNSFGPAPLRNFVLGVNYSF